MLNTLALVDVTYSTDCPPMQTRISVAWHTVQAVAEVLITCTSLTHSPW